MQTICGIKRYIIDLYKTIKLHSFYLNGKKCENKKMTFDNSPQIVVSMIDGRLKHGGLSDRICGIVSAFQYCLMHNKEFKINFVYPYDLGMFLEPNEYDWRLNSNELSYCKKNAIPMYISLFSHNVNIMRKYADSKLNKNIKQIHLYSNMHYFYFNEFGDLFNKLFKKTKMLDDAVNKCLINIGEKYVSITFRFQQLLGDFKESGFPSINSDKEKNILIERCCNIIKYVHEKENKRVVVTSDSNSFTKYVNDLFDYVYVVPGTVVHMDYVQGNEKIDVLTHLKSFVDFFVLANAETIYLGNIAPLYGSSFSKTASMVYGKKYVEITDKSERIEWLKRSEPEDIIVDARNILRV